MRSNFSLIKLGASFLKLCIYAQFGQRWDLSQTVIPSHIFCKEIFVRFLLRNIFEFSEIFATLRIVASSLFTRPSLTGTASCLPQIKIMIALDSQVSLLPSVFLLTYMGQSMHHDNKLRWSVIIIILSITMIIRVRLRRQFVLATRTWSSSPSTSPSSPSLPWSPSSPSPSECDYGGSAAWKSGHGHRPHHSLCLHKQSTLSGIKG